MKTLLILIGSLFLISACCHRPPQIITQTNTVYRVIPDEYFKCDLPDTLTEEQIQAIVMEAQYNGKIVLPIDISLDQCYASIQRLKEFNEENKNLNQ